MKVIKMNGEEEEDLQEEEKKSGKSLFQKSQSFYLGMYKQWAGGVDQESPVLPPTAGWLKKM